MTAKGFPLSRFFRYNRDSFCRENDFIETQSFISTRLVSAYD